MINKIIASQIFTIHFFRTGLSVHKIWDLSDREEMKNGK